MPITVVGRMTSVLFVGIFLALLRKLFKVLYFLWEFKSFLIELLKQKILKIMDFPCRLSFFSHLYALMDFIKS